jgi:hypothetical protein
VDIRLQSARSGTALCERCRARRCGWGRSDMRLACWSRSSPYCGGTTLRERYANVDAAVVDVEVAGHSSSMRRVHTQRVRTLGGRVRAGKETSLSSPLTSMCRRMYTATIGAVMIRRRPCFPPPSESALAFLPHNFLYLDHNKSRIPRLIGPRTVKFHEQRSRPLL